MLLHYFRSFPLALLTTLTLSLLPRAGGAADASPPPAPLVFAFSELAPWKTKDGEAYGGAYTEIMRELARRLGRTLSFAECPHKRCLVMMATGAADLYIGVQQSPEREQTMQFLRTPYRRTASDRVFYVRRGDAARIRRYEDLYGLHIGIRSASEYFDRFDTDERLLKESAPSNAANLQKLILGRVDAVVIPEDQGAVLLNTLGLGAQLETAHYREQDGLPRSIAVSRKSEAMALLPRMEAAMQAMRNDGTLGAIYDRHYYQRYHVTRQQIRLD